MKKFIVSNAYHTLILLIKEAWNVTKVLILTILTKNFLCFLAAVIFPLAFFSLR